MVSLQHGMTAVPTAVMKGTPAPGIDVVPRASHSPDMIRGHGSPCGAEPKRTRQMESRARTRRRRVSAPERRTLSVDVVLGKEIAYAIE
jgi:hypothetical protein